jgi:hypothetical protein
MFSDKIQNLITAMAVRKLGPVEFQEQVKPAARPDQAVEILQREFPEHLPLFSLLTQAFAPLTKALLRLMIAHDKPLKKTELRDLASKLGIPENNVTATSDALVQSGCIAAGEDGMIRVSEIGRDYLRFESRLEQLFRSAP